MRLSDFRYELPKELIAQQPLPERTQSRLLAVGATPQDLVFADLPSLLRPGDLLVMNDTRVIPARLFGQKESGGRAEILIERLTGSHSATAHIRASRSPKPGSALLVDGNRLRVVGRDEGLFDLRSEAGAFDQILQAHGHMPLPPYIERADEQSDRERYQTVFAERPGAVAAPTAGLHFDQAMLTGLAEMGVTSTRVTLHVGAGTFQPVRSDNLDEHRMHAEWLEVSADACEKIARTKAAGGRVVAIGTTSVRALESAAAGGELRPFQGDTRLFIRPGYRFRVVDALLTNFHLPESTLLMLVCAFSGYERVMSAYGHAVRQGYRFFSYGDAMFLESAENK